MTTGITFTMAGSTVRLGTTAHVDRVVARLGRAARAGRSGDVVGLVVVADMAGARKLQRVLRRYWAGQGRQIGGAQFAATAEDIRQLLDYLQVTYGLACYAPGQALSGPSRRAIFQHFARGKKSRRAAADVGSADGQVLDELLAAGYVTKHKRRAAGTIEYRGTVRCSRVVAQVAAGQVPVTVLPTATPAEPRRATEFRMQPDPSMSDAEYWHQRQTDKGEDVGKVTVAMNMIEVIGGFARFTDRSEAQEAAAKKFRSLHDRAQLGGAKAIDYAKAKVDASGMSAQAVADTGEDARQQYASAVAHLGASAGLVEHVVVHDTPIRKLASGARARSVLQQQLRDALDDLAKHFGAAERTHADIRADGDIPSTFTGVVATRKIA